MRMIDADELKENISKYEFTAPNERYKQGGECVLNFYMPKIIDDAPTIDAEPVRHGKWEEISSVRKIGKCNIPISKCVCCGFSLCDILNNNGLYNYCPNCGAKMDQEDNP